MTVIDPPDADQPAPTPSLGRIYGTAIVMPLDGGTTTIALRKQVVRVGRAPDNDIVLDDEGVSAYHAQIFCRNVGFEVLDLDEAEGATLVDATLLPSYVPILLADNSVVQFGRTRMFLYPPDEPFDAAQSGTGPLAKAAPLAAEPPRKAASPAGEAGNQPAGGGTYGLAVILGPHSRQDVPINRLVLWIGRAADNDIVIAEPFIDDYHAQLIHTPEGFNLIMLATAERQSVEDVIELGSWRIMLYGPAAPASEIGVREGAQEGAPGAAASGSAESAAVTARLVPTDAAGEPSSAPTSPSPEPPASEAVIDVKAIEVAPGAAQGGRAASFGNGAHPDSPAIADSKVETIILPPASGSGAPWAADGSGAIQGDPASPWDAPGSIADAASPAGDAAPRSQGFPGPAPAEESGASFAPDAPAGQAGLRAPAPGANGAPAEVSKSLAELGPAGPADLAAPSSASGSPAGAARIYGTAIVRYPDGRTATIPLNRPTIRLGRAPSNDLVLDDPAAADQHAQIFCTSEMFYVLDLQSASGTRLDNRSLPPYVMQGLSHNSVIQIGEIAIFLYPPAGDEPAPAPPERAPETVTRNVPRLPVAPERPESRAISRLSLAPANLALDAGGRVDLVVSFVNQSQVLGRVSVVVVGLPTPWVQVAEQAVPVFPGASGEVKIAVAPPRDPASLAGVYGFTVEVRSDQAPGEVWTVRSTLTVRPYTQFSVALFPRYQSARRRAAYEVEIANRGNHVETFELHCFDEHNAFDQPFVSRMIWIKPGTSHRAAFRLTLKSWHWWIGRRQGYHFVVSARSSDNQVERAKGIFIHVPLLTRGTKYPAAVAPSRPALPPPAQPTALALPEPPAAATPTRSRARRAAGRDVPADAAAGANARAIPATQQTIPLAAPLAADKPDVYQPAHLAMTSTSFTIEAGAAATTTLSVINRSSVVDRIELSVVGLPTAWVTIIPESLPLLPNAQAEAQLIISPPRHARSLAETTRFRVVARSEKRPDQQVVALATLTIRPFSEFKVDIYPKEQKARRQGRYQLQVTNKGNQAQTFQIQGLSEDGALDFTCATPDLAVPPGESRRAELRARIQDTRIVGSSQLYGFMAGAQPADQPDLLQQVPARLADKPWIPQWFLQMVVLPLFLVAFALLMYFGRGKIADLFRSITGSSNRPAATTGNSAGGAVGGGASLAVTPTIALDSQPAFTAQTPITTELHWTVEESPKVLRVNTAVPAGTLLVIDPGVEVQLASRVRLTVEGQLIANGTSAAPVKFRNADGGAWDGIYVRAGGVAYLLNSQLQDAGARDSAIVAQGGALIVRDSALSGNDGGVYSADGYLELQRVSMSGNDLAHSPAVAVRLGAKSNAVIDTVSVEGNTFAADAAMIHVVVSGAQGTLDIRNNVFADKTQFGVLIEAAAAYGANLTCNSFSNSAIGLGLTTRGGADLAGTQLAIGNNSFLSNSQLGVFSDRAVNAANNWWGTPAGPSAAGQPAKASAQAGVTPWLDAAPACASSP